MKPVIRVAFLVLIGLGVAARPGAQERVLVRQASKHARVRDIRTPGTQPAAQPVLTADDLFDPDVVHDVLLTVHARDWLDLRQNYRENTYDPADLRWRGLVVRNVGIRSRGTGSRSPIKPGLRVDFNRYSEAQEFLGLKSIVLDNHVQDPSMLKERLTMRFFSEMGIPAPRTAYARLFVNDALVGLYSIVESVDKKFLTRHFGENDGYLFEFTYTDPYGFEYLGPDLERYAEFFAPRTHEFESMFTLYWPIREMTWTFSETPASRFADASSQFMDLHVFLKHVAVESFVADNDGLLGNWGMNNFYLYRFEDSTRSQLVPWDKDSAFWGLEYDVWTNIHQNVVMRRALQEPALYAVYLDALRRCAEVAMRPPETDPPDEEAQAAAGLGWLERQVLEAYELIKGAAREDPNKPFDNERFEDENAKVLEFARHRAAYVLREVDKGVSETGQ